MTDEPSDAEVGRCSKCGVEVTDQTPSQFYLYHDDSCGGDLREPNSLNDQDRDETHLASTGWEGNAVFDAFLAEKHERGER